MTYNLDWLKNQIKDEDQLNFIFFWREFLSIDGGISKACFSQWWYSPFIFNDVTFNTTEHWMMAKKALLFDDSVSFQKIINAQSPSAAKSLGRNVLNFDQTVWDQHKFDIVVKGNLLKFNQNKQLRDFLLGTNDNILVEASPYDRIWGIGLDENSPDVKNPVRWRGLNLLGFALMEVRDIIRNKILKESLY